MVVKKLNREEYKKLALKWAPINYQYIKLKNKIQNNGRDDLPIETKRDLLVPINLDGYTDTCECGFMKHEHTQDIEKNEKYSLNKSNLRKFPCSNFSLKYKNPEDAWDTHNRRQKLTETLTENLVPVAYYSISTTTNYFYILYSFYHADDKKHPNDMEGCLVIVERNKNKDRLVGMLTVAHLFFPRYVYKNRIKFQVTDFENAMKNLKENKSLDLDIGKEPLSKRIRNIEQRLKVLSLIGKMEADEEDGPVRALIQQETQGHGLYALGGSIAWPYSWLRKLWQLKNNIDIIQYYPSESAIPYDVDDLTRYKGMPHLTSFYYELIDIHESHGLNGLWNWTKSSKVFTEEGHFHGKDAKPPWLWVEKNGGDSYTLWDNPAELCDLYFKPIRGKPFIDGKKYVKTMDQPEDKY